MNANELADELVDLIVAPTPVDDKWACELIDQAATMLRQQQAEIEALKAHPVKELTDEEIEECYWGDGYPDNPRHPKEFARAILRKAQEK